MKYIELCCQEGKWNVAALCRVLQVSESGYYKYLRNKSKPYKYADLLKQIYELLKEDPENANYGVKRMYKYLRNYKAYEGSYSTIYRICKENNLMIRCKRRPKGITKADSEAQKAENLINQDFTAQSPNEKWLMDITEIPCKNGKLYLAPVLDCYDGSIRGFKMDTNMKAELCVEAFKLACREDGARGIILHSDRGSQFTSNIFRNTLTQYGVIQSMSSVGRCYDNARMESFFATLKKRKTIPDGYYKNDYSRG
ncbi:MAG: IS3 family transposase [Syntrophomonadaceae bacterium]|nr:IS3 family transposase [Syntrophomonadaceae bacterium]